MWIALLLLLQTHVQCRVAARQTDESGLNVCLSLLVFWLCPKSEVDSPRHHVISCHQHLSEYFSFGRVELQRNASRKKLPSSLDACYLHGSLSVSYYLVESADQIRRVSFRVDWQRFELGAMWDMEGWPAQAYL